MCCLHIAPLVYLVFHYVWGICSNKGIIFIHRHNPFDFSFVAKRFSILCSSFALFLAQIHFHGTDLNKLHKRFSTRILPSEFGGTKGPFNAATFYELLKEKEAIFAEEFEYGYPSESE